MSHQPESAENTREHAFDSPATASQLSTGTSAFPPPPLDLQASAGGALQMKAESEDEASASAQPIQQMASHDTGCGCDVCQMQVTQAKQAGGTVQMQVAQMQRFQDRNDIRVFQDDHTFDNGEVGLRQQIQIYTLPAGESVTVSCLNDEQEEENRRQSVVFTGDWVQENPAAIAVLNGRIRHEMAAMIENGHDNLIEGWLTEFEEAGHDQGRLEQLEEDLGRARARAGREGWDAERAMNTGPYLVEEGSRGASWLGRGYNSDHTADQNLSEEDMEALLRRRADSGDRRAENAIWERENASSFNSQPAGIRHRRIRELVSQRRISPGTSRPTPENSDPDPRLQNKLYTRYTRLHAAWDIGGPENTAVYTPLNGHVISIGNSTTYGNHVRIRHDHAPPTTAGPGRRGQARGEETEVPVTTHYCHLNTVLLRPGQSVFAGQAIGLLGDTGSGGMHLHFSVVLRGGLSSANEAASGLRPREWWQQVTGSDNPYRPASQSEEEGAQGEQTEP